MKRRILIVSHGEFANGLKNAVEMILGQQDNLVSIGMLDGMGADKYSKNLKMMCEKFNKSDQIVLMSDLAEGSPMTSALMVMENNGFSQNMIALAGMNLPMVVTAVMCGNVPMEKEELKEEILKESKKQLRSMEFKDDVEDEI